MKTQWIEKIIDYDGSQLRSGWIEKQTGLAGEAIVTFIGKCDVKPEYMVDLEDLSAGLAISSPKMLHFIGEFTDRDLEKAILKQRLLISQMHQLLSYSRDHSVSPNYQFRLNPGKDIHCRLYQVLLNILPPALRQYDNHSQWHSTQLKNL